MVWKEEFSWVRMTRKKSFMGMDRMRVWCRECQQFEGGLLHAWPLPAEFLALLVKDLLNKEGRRRLK